MNAKIREEGKKKRKKNGKMRCVQKSEKEEAGGAENGGSWEKERERERENDNSMHKGNEGVNVNGKKKKLQEIYKWKNENKMNQEMRNSKIKCELQ